MQFLGVNVILSTGSLRRHGQFS